MTEKSTFPTISQVIYRRREFDANFLVAIPEQNGVAERKNRKIEEAAREMIEEKHMPKFYWAEAVQIAIYL